jgi:hypothetical protein
MDTYLFGYTAKCPSGHKVAGNHISQDIGSIVDASDSGTPTLVAAFRAYLIRFSLQLCPLPSTPTFAEIGWFWCVEVSTPSDASTGCELRLFNVQQRPTISYIWLRANCPPISN